jgi:hypothetical protein
MEDRADLSLPEAGLILIDGGNTMRRLAVALLLFCLAGCDARCEYTSPPPPPPKPPKKITPVVKEVPKRAEEEKPAEEEAAPAPSQEEVKRRQQAIRDYIALEKKYAEAKKVWKAFYQDRTNRQKWQAAVDKLKECLELADRLQKTKTEDMANVEQLFIQINEDYRAILYDKPE